MKLIKKLIFITIIFIIAGTVSACEPAVRKDQPSTTSDQKPVVVVTKPVKRTETPKNLKLTSGYNKITVKYKAVKNCKYQIKFSKYKSMKSAKTITTKKTKYTIKKLNGNQRYYIQIRAFKNKNYSKWSNRKSIKAKKKIQKKYKHSGTFVITYYCTGACCNGNSHRRTASGTYLTPGRSIAVDPRVIPLGTYVYINGHRYRAEDTGGAIKGNRIDICVSSHSECNRRGKHRAVVKW